MEELIIRRRDPIRSIATMLCEILKEVIKKIVRAASANEVICYSSKIIMYKQIVIFIFAPLGGRPGMRAGEGIISLRETNRAESTA